MAVCFLLWVKHLQTDLCAALSPSIHPELESMLQREKKMCWKIKKVSIKRWWCSERWLSVSHFSLQAQQLLAWAAPAYILFITTLRQHYVGFERNKSSNKTTHAVCYGEKLQYQYVPFIIFKQFSSVWSLRINHLGWANLKMLCLCEEFFRRFQSWEAKS